MGSARVAALALAGSGAMCIVYPFLADAAPAVRIAALVFWGVCVVADSPQFSAMSAENAPPEWLGSALVAQGTVLAAQGDEKAAEAALEEGRAQLLGSVGPLGPALHAIPRSSKA